MRDYVQQNRESRANATQIAQEGGGVSLKPPVQRHGEHEGRERWPSRGRTADDRMTTGTSRFRGDAVFEEIAAGTTTLTNFSESLQARKMQQALVDLGYDVGSHGVDGKFGPDTEAALREYQGDVPVPETGEFDQATLTAFNNSFGDRQPYLDEATRDPANPGEGLRTLSGADRRAVQDALTPPRGTGGRSATFQEEVNGDHYGPSMEQALRGEIARLHQDLYASKVGLRADPDNNFHDWDVIEATAQASKDVTDAIYGSYATGDPIQHEITDPVSGATRQGNLIDGWEDEIARNSRMSAPQQRQKAHDMIWYLISSNFPALNRRHSAVPTDTAEQAILDPIVENLLNEADMVDKMLQIEIGWEGAQLEGTIYLQRYRQDTDEANIRQLWTLFHVCIHEYIHGLAHDRFLAYAGRQDDIRYNTLVEGFCDFFTENVRQSLNIDDALQQRIEGPYYQPGNPILTDVNAGIYPSMAQAEQVVSIVGIRNAQAAYFRGQTRFMRGTT